VDRTRVQLDPIRTLSALTDSFAREGHVLSGSTRASGPFISGTALEFAYLTRWIELDRGRRLRGWRQMCGVATR
jgi:hypothetical protein